MKDAPSPARKTGRPLSFDRPAALKQAMLVFWRQGYEATSLSDLTNAMGIKPPSVYAAFGNKKQLFLESVRSYLAGPPSARSIIEAAASARDAAIALLESAACGDTGEHTPPGCLLASSAIACSIDADDVRVELARMRGEIEALLKNRIERGIALGELPEDADADALAGHVMVVIQGMSTLARDGANREKLTRIRQTAMASWPSR